MSRTMTCVNRLQHLQLKEATNYTHGIRDSAVQALLLECQSRKTGLVPNTECRSLSVERLVIIIVHSPRCLTCLTQYKILYDISFQSFSLLISLNVLRFCTKTAKFQQKRMFFLFHFERQRWRSPSSEIPW